MSFEQQETERNSEIKKKKKLEKEKNEHFFLEKKILQESTDLLQKLALQISKDFGIDISQARELLSEKTGNSLESFKNSLSQNSEININDLEKAIGRARESISQLSKKNREYLKNSLDMNSYFPENHIYTTTRKIFSSKTIQRAEKPQTITDQFIGAGIGIIDSTEAIILFTYALGKGILLTPYHIYLIITGKAKYRGFENI